MDLKPVLLDFVCQPEIAKVEDKFGPVVLQVLPKLRMQNVNSMRLTLSDGKHQASGVYQRASALSENFFAEGQLIEIKKYQMLLSNGRPYIYFLSFEPRGIAPVTTPEKLTASLFASVRESKNLSLDGGPGSVPEEEEHVGVPGGGAGNGTAAANAAGPRRGIVGPIGPETKKEKERGIYGIEAVSPFLQAWKIRARLMNKSEIITYKKGENEGKLFNVTFVDETGEIRATAFKDDVDKWYKKLSENHVYIVSGLKVNNANKKFSTTNNEFELIFTRDTNIEQTEGDDSIPAYKVSYTPLDKLASLPAQRNVDVLGIITTIGDCSTINSRSGQTFEKRSVYIVDKSNNSVELSFWGKEAEDFIGQIGEPIAVKTGKLGEYMGAKNVSVQRASKVLINPHSPEAITLKTWYENEGKNATFTKLKTEDTVAGLPKSKVEVDNIIDAIANRKDGEFFHIRAVVDAVLPRTLYYPACASEGCLKKVIQNTNGDWRCESCDKEFPKPQYRYVLNIIAMDSTPSTAMRVSVFDDIGKELLECDANEVAEYREQDEESEQVKSILKRPQGKEYLMRLQAKLESYNGQENMRFRCVRLMSLHHNKWTNDILDEILNDV